MQLCPTGSPWEDGSTSTARALVVVADAAMRQFVAEALRRRKFEVVEAITAVQAMRLVQMEGIELAIIDAVLSGWNGVALCSMLRAFSRTSGLQVIIVDGSPALTSADDARIVGAAYLRKPFTLDELLRLTDCVRRQPPHRARP